MVVQSVGSAEIKAALRQAGVQRGDTLMCHSSMKSFGHVDGGPDAVIDALLDMVGPDGHVLMPTLTSTYAGTGGELSVYAFNPKTTPSRVGKLTDTFWRRSNAVRSQHATH